MQRNSAQAGQVGVMVLLVSAIVLVIGLSIANRVVKENQRTIAQEDSARVFSTAESGVQQALSSIFQFESGTGELASSFSFQDANLNEVSIEPRDHFDGYIASANAVELRINNGQTGDLTFHWSKQPCGAGGSNLLIAHYFTYGSVTEYSVNYYLVGNCIDFSNQNFIPANQSGYEDYRFTYTLPIAAGKNQGAFLRIIPLSGTDVYVSGSSGLLSDSQYKILSLAQMPDGSTATAIEVRRSIKTPPAFMDFALVSGTNLEK